MANELDKGIVDIPCPGCGHKNRKTVRWLKSHKQFTCAGCGKVEIETSALGKGLRDADAEIAKLTKSFEKLGRIKL